MNVQAAQSRKTTFQNMQQAEKYFRKRLPWSLWDPRIIETFLEHGLMTLPNSTEVTTKCKTSQEVWSYEPYVHLLAGHLYGKLCTTFPVHAIFGERPEMYSKKTRDVYSDGKEGRVLASVAVIPRTGHLLVQERPDEAAQHIARVLSKVSSNKVDSIRAHL
ncbi:hypothetical protein SISSUDRAFT_413040 [Sistotremastrum suecicum HHB10207 ss-3]|uniref:Uncharacterized protein n=1 Tax=Sistotremastrum suecicum HHB10207 ss-3 TaxID=1314776 RepID=A0A166FNE4_9AGAM|nr:hypothetical protein SISSUDRAFT_413040 [Sistotremastrum suecicum HHB10207 ss-3]